jgi:hypothetical protein
MRRFLATTAAIVISLALVTTSAAADDRGNSASSTALAACKARAKAKKVTVTVKVDGKATTYRYVCSEILAATGKLPAVGDFTIGLDVLAKQCFASAGCSVAYRPKVKYRGTTPLDPSKAYTVVYEVDGAESPITANVTVRGDKITAQRGTAYLPTKGTDLSVKVTSVLEDGAS